MIAHGLPGPVVTRERHDVTTWRLQVKQRGSPHSQLDPIGRKVNPRPCASLFCTPFARSTTLLTPSSRSYLNPLSFPRFQYHSIFARSSSSLSFTVFVHTHTHTPFSRLARFYPLTRTRVPAFHFATVQPSRVQILECIREWRFTRHRSRVYTSLAAQRHNR